MAQARTAASSITLPRVQVIAPTHIGSTAIAALQARGIEARATHRADPQTGDIVAWALETIPTANAVLELAKVCAAAADSGRPVCVLAPTLRGSGRAVLERAASLSYLRAYGAALSHDVDAWLEAVVALVRFGMPSGPRVALVAPGGSWLEAQALSLASEAEAAGLRVPIVGIAAADVEQTDVVLFDTALGPAPSHLPGLHIPVIARGELGGELTALFGARSAIGAIDMLGRASERIAVGLGPAPRTATAELEVDRDRLERQLAKLPAAMRVGDHETKVLMSAYGVPITRQAVATTPSAAVKKARSAGYPVELKPWGHDLPTEPAGCPVERGITSDALVRRAFSAVLAAAGRVPTKNDPGAVIVRETPPAGRDVSVSFVELPALGWTVILDAPGAAHVAAAPAPLRLAYALGLAAAVVASRAGDPDPDRTGLANLLRRLSHLVVDLGDRLARFEVPRVVVGGRGARTVVVDAWCELA